ncbi:unnamed protein product [Cochlearia groenlandica]
MFYIQPRCLLLGNCIETLLRLYLHVPAIVEPCNAFTSSWTSKSVLGVNLTTKLARICDLMEDVGRYITSYSPSSMAYYANPVDIFGLWSTFFIGCEVTNTIGCD